MLGVCKGVHGVYPPGYNVRQRGILCEFALVYGEHRDVFCVRSLFSNTRCGLFYRIRLYTVRLASSGDGGAQV